VDRYSFLVRNFHSLLHAGLARRTVIDFATTRHIAVTVPKAHNGWLLVRKPHEEIRDGFNQSGFEFLTIDLEAALALPR
jgi:hypothetical protein